MKIFAVIKRSYAWLSIVLSVVLFLICLVFLPSILSPANLISTLGILAPLILVTMAATPSILSGGGGIDISVGPLIMFTNVSMFTILPFLGIQSPFGIVATLLLLGAIVGTISGLLVTVVRLQPIVATLGVNLVLMGLSKHLMPEPTGIAEPWLKALAGYIGPIPGPILVVAVTLILWWLFTKMPYYKALLAVGGDDKTAFSSGLPVNLIRTLAYTIGGFLCALAAIQLTAFTGAGDANVGANYTMIAIAAVAIGGTKMLGGRGGMLGAVFGAITIFLIQKVLAVLGASSFWFQVAYGVMLLLALMSNSLIQISSKKEQRA